MNKAIFYKERIKMRRIIPIAILLLALFTAYAIIAVWRRYTYSGAASVWLAVLERGDVLFGSLRYLPALLGAAFAVAQFVPEMVQNRLKLTLHLPDNRNAMVLAMLGYGTAWLGGLFAVQLAVIDLWLRQPLASELVHAVITTMLPWYIAGFAAYLFGAWICLEPTWHRRAFDALVAAGVLRLCFLNESLSAGNTLLVWLVLAGICALFFPLHSVDRFRRGCQD